MVDSIHSKTHGTISGLCIGDSLAMPVHWYYNRQALNADYGMVQDYLAPHNPHPDSNLWRSSYVPPNQKGEIVHDQAQFWGQKDIHYHQFLKAGENTLNVKICRLVIESINHTGNYDADDFLGRYIAYMTTSGNHRDTYIEACHRNFFINYARGQSPRNCGVEEKHIGGLVGMIPIVAFYFDQPEKARESALLHISLTHPGKKMAAAGSLIVDILLKVLDGTPLKPVIIEKLESQNNPFMGHPFLKWINDPDDRVIGSRVSPACYVEDAVPAVIYLALKYHDDPETALIANTNLGGDNAARGAVLGALLGASHGVAGFPNRWVNGLLEPLPDLRYPPPG